MSFNGHRIDSFISVLFLTNLHIRLIVNYTALQGLWNVAEWTCKGTGLVRLVFFCCCLFVCLFVTDVCKYQFKLLQDVCGVPEDSELQWYKEVSLLTCFELCTVLHNETCSGVLYGRKSRSCTVTKFTIESGQRYENCTARPPARYYRRRRCLCECNPQWIPP